MIAASYWGKVSTAIIGLLEISKPTAFLLRLKTEPLVKQYKNNQESKYVEIK